MITYEWVREDLTVVFLYKLWGKKRRIGKIVKAEGVYRYYPKGSILYGNGYNTLDECKESLEDKDNDNHKK